MRDILYLDQDLLASYYAQAFKGVTERLTYGKASEKTSEERSSANKGNDSFAAELALASSETESKVLHDYMLTLLEERLKSDTLNINGDNIDSLLVEALQHPLVNATGVALIEDYGRMINLVSKFESVAEAVGYISHQSEENKLRLDQLEAEANQKTGPAKAEALKKVRAMRNPKSFREAGGMHMEPAFMKHLKSFMETFKQDALDITIVIDGATTQCRVVLDQQWLRIPPTILRELFSLRIQGAVTVVGQITWIPSMHNATKQDNYPGEDMRSAIKNILMASDDLEGLTSRSEDCPELTLRPLAVYRELALAT